MDDVVRKVFTLFTVLLIPGVSAAADLTYVTPAQVAELKTKYEAAHFGPADLETLTNAKAWRCDLYGVQTRLQVRRDIEVYKFERLIPTADIKNTGAQPISTYVVGPEALRGAGERGLVDEIRVTGQHELIAKLSLPERGVTVAFTLCHGS